MFFLSDSAPTVFYTLSLHDALPISCGGLGPRRPGARPRRPQRARVDVDDGSPRPARRRPHGRLAIPRRSEEHTSELQSHHDLVCRLLLEKKKKVNTE